MEWDEVAMLATLSSQPTDQRLLFRIGTNVGNVMVKDGGIFGDSVNIAQPIRAFRVR